MLHPAFSQDVQTCIGYKTLYKANLDGRVGSTFLYTLNNGGSIVTSNPTDSIVVQWGQQTGIYPLGVRETSQLGCDGEWAYLNVQLIGRKVQFSQNVYYMCLGDSVQIDFNRSDYYGYKWIGKSGKSDYFTAPGRYEIEASDKDGCLIHSYVTIAAKPTPVVHFGRDTMICTPEFRLHAAHGNVNPSGTIFTWSTGERGTNPYIDIITHDIQKPTSYWATAEYDGCSASDTIVLLACQENNEIFDDIPNTFTPNADGDNDVWEIRKLRTYPNAMVEVFDRWGRKVFTSAKGYPQPWDGRDTKGHVLPMETYYYIINLNDGKNTKPILGTITIIR